MKLKKLVEKLRDAAIERYGTDNGMGGEMVLNLDDVIEIVKKWFGLREIKDKVSEQQLKGWISIDERLPNTNDYILLSFSNFTNSVIGRYETDEDGSGAFYIGDELETCLSQNLFVNAWQQLPNPYEEV